MQIDYVCYIALPIHDKFTQTYINNMRIYTILYFLDSYATKITSMNDMIILKVY